MSYTLMPMLASRMGWNWVACRRGESGGKKGRREGGKCCHTRAWLRLIYVGRSPITADILSSTIPHGLHRLSSLSGHPFEVQLAQLMTHHAVGEPQGADEAPVGGLTPAGRQASGAGWQNVCQGIHRILIDLISMSYNAQSPPGRGLARHAAMATHQLLASAQSG
jgi:hypothetical protein